MPDLNPLAQEMYDAFGNTDRDVDSMIDRYVAEDFVEHEQIPGFDNTRETPRQLLKKWRAAFPDFRMNVQDLLQEGDKVVARITATGTHQGEFMSMPATGNSISVDIIDILRLEDHKMVEHWGVSDTASMMEQLGIGSPGG